MYEPLHRRLIRFQQNQVAPTGLNRSRPLRHIRGIYGKIYRSFPAVPATLCPWF